MSWTFKPRIRNIHTKKQKTSFETVCDSQYSCWFLQKSFSKNPNGESSYAKSMMPSQNKLATNFIFETQQKKHNFTSYENPFPVVEFGLF